MKKITRLKKLIAMLMVLVVIVCTSAVALADTPQPGQAETAVTNMLITYAVRIAATLLLTLISVLGAWLTALVGKNKKMQTVAVALHELVEATKTTVGSLQQKVVDNLKAAHEDGKLTKDEIKMLGAMLKDKTLQKLSQPAYEVLEAASVDIEAWIEDAAEDWIRALKLESGVLLEDAVEIIE